MVARSIFKRHGENVSYWLNAARLVDQVSWFSRATKGNSRSASLRILPISRVISWQVKVDCRRVNRFEQNISIESEPFGYSGALGPLRGLHPSETLDHTGVRPSATRPAAKRLSRRAPSRPKGFIGLQSKPNSTRICGVISSTVCRIARNSTQPCRFETWTPMR
jgi:hypothetical protein